MDQASELARPGVFAAFPVFAGQQAATQRRPQGCAQAQGFGHRQQVPLGTAFGQAVLGLDRDNRRIATNFGQQVGTGDAPGREVGQAGVEDLARTHQVVEATEDFFHGGQAVADMCPEQVDLFGVQALQAFLDRADHVLAVVAGMGNPRVRGGAHGVFGRHHQAIAFGGDELADHHLGLSGLIAVGGVDEVAAGLQVTVEDPLCLFALGAMTPAGTEVAGAQRQFRNTQAATAAKDFVVHGVTPGGRLDFGRHLFNIIRVIYLVKRMFRVCRLLTIPDRTLC